MPRVTSHAQKGEGGCVGNRMDILQRFKCHNNTFICVIKYSCRVYIVDSPKHSVLIHYTSKGSYVVECVQFSVCDYSKPNEFIFMKLLSVK